MKKIFKEFTLFIKDGVMLEKFRDLLFFEGESITMGFDETYEGEVVVNSGYIHFNGKTFFLSKNNLEKTTITLEELELKLK